MMPMPPTRILVHPEGMSILWPERKASEHLCWQKDFVLEIICAITKFYRLSRPLSIALPSKIIHYVPQMQHLRPFRPQPAYVPKKAPGFAYS